MLPTSWPSAMIILAASCAGIGPVNAAVDLSGGATVAYEHDSNPIELSDSNAQEFLNRGYIKSKDDTAKRLTAKVAAAMGAVNGPTQLKLHAVYTKVDNTHFDTIDHSEYNYGGNLDWKPGQLFDASLQASQVRAPVEQNDVGGQRVVLQTASVAEGTLRVRPVPQWQISLTPRWYNTKLPLPGAADFELRETSGTVGLGYLGAGPLIPGVFFTQARGRYSGIVNATKYEQQTYGVSLNYKVTDFSAFSLLAGRTERKTHLIVPSTNPQALLLEGTQPAYTGALSYQRQLSVKTAINVSAFREFQQYDGGVNTTLGTGFGAGVVWNATAKLSATFDAKVIRSTINGLQIAGSNDERKDLERSFALGAKYLATRFVSLHPYVTRRLHNSTGRSSVFDRTIAGLELTVAVD